MEPALGLAVLAVAQFVYIGLKAFQQINVQRYQIGMVMPTSMAMAVIEVYVISTLAARGWGIWVCLVFGLSAGLGSLTAMKVQKVYRERPKYKAAYSESEDP